ncbi:VanZ family protein [Cytobacillus sp. FSL M8-0252]|uniref:VanZ family protein n=1 Tax=Cytobacillus TaxID=2675230 RepID=UPI0030F72AEE
MKKQLYWLPSILWMAMIFILSHQPGTQSSQLSGGITEVIAAWVPFSIENLHTLETFIRKNAHFFAYFILGIFILFAIRQGNILTRQKLLISWILTTVYAASDEFHQLFIPGRSGEVRDVLIDSVGAATGLILFSIVYYWRKSKNRGSL